MYRLRKTHVMGTSSLDGSTTSRKGVAGAALGDFIAVLLIVLFGVVVGGYVMWSSGEHRAVCEGYHDLQDIWRTAVAISWLRGSCPASIEELVADGVRVREEVGLDRGPRDPYGNSYTYGVRNGRPFVIYWGKDNSPGGEGLDRDWLWPSDQARAKSPGPRVR